MYTKIQLESNDENLKSLNSKIFFNCGTIVLILIIKNKANTKNKIFVKI